MTKRKIKITLEYDGTDYAGWQYQPDVATVQGTVEEALAKILKEPVRVHGAARTDAGVHAAGQVAHFVTTSRMTPEEFLRALNALLPRDVHVTAAEEAPPEFHARYSAKSRTYRFALTFVDSVFTRRHAYHVPGPLDLEAMRAGAAFLLGVHDFAAFGNASEDYASTVREVMEARLQETINGAELYITANAFLYKMVRNIVGALLKIGRGEAPPEIIVRALAARDRDALRSAEGANIWNPAPPHGLTLMRVTY